MESPDQALFQLCFSKNFVSMDISFVETFEATSTKAVDMVRGCFSKLFRETDETDLTNELIETIISLE